MRLIPSSGSPRSYILIYVIRQGDLVQLVTVLPDWKVKSGHVALVVGAYYFTTNMSLDILRTLAKGWTSFPDLTEQDRILKVLLGGRCVNVPEQFVKRYDPQQFLSRPRHNILRRVK